MTSATMASMIGSVMMVLPNGIQLFYSWAKPWMNALPGTEASVKSIAPNRSRRKKIIGEVVCWREW
jgi:hypothetical protein